MGAADDHVDVGLGTANDGVEVVATGGSLQVHIDRSTLVGGGSHVVAIHAAGQVVGLIQVALEHTKLVGSASNGVADCRQLGNSRSLSGGRNGGINNRGSDRLVSALIDANQLTALSKLNLAVVIVELTGNGNGVTNSQCSNSIQVVARQTIAGNVLGFAGALNIHENGNVLVASIVGSLNFGDNAGQSVFLGQIQVTCKSVINNFLGVGGSYQHLLPAASANAGSIEAVLLGGGAALATSAILAGNNLGVAFSILLRIGDLIVANVNVGGHGNPSQIPNSNAVLVAGALRGGIVGEGNGIVAGNGSLQSPGVRISSISLDAAGCNLEIMGQLGTAGGLNSNGNINTILLAPEIGIVKGQALDAALQSGRIQRTHSGSLTVDNNSSAIAKGCLGSIGASYNHSAALGSPTVSRSVSSETVLSATRAHGLKVRTECGVRKCHNRQQGQTHDGRKDNCDQFFHTYLSS